MSGSRQLTFPGINGENRSYALIVHAYLNGVKGVGYYVHAPDGFAKNLVPLVDSFEDRRITLAHGDSVGERAEQPLGSQLSYNTSFIILTEDYTLREIPLAPSEQTGSLVYGAGGEQEFASLTVPNNEGILAITYKGTSQGQYGIVLMPWGLSSLSFPVIFGGNPLGQEWVTTDLRQVTIGGVSYQAKLALWSLQGHQGSG
jgi:hypothetical protein